MNSNAALVLLVVVLAGAAHADTIQLAPGDDVAAAIVAAAPGDTLLFAAGTYDAPLSVPFGKNGLVLKAKGEVVIDARPGGAAVGPAVSVQSDDVTLQGFTIQHAALGPSAEGIKAFDDGSLEGIDGLVVRQCRILNSAGLALLVVGDGTVVEDCLISGATGVSITGDGARVERSELRDLTENGLQIVGEDAFVSKVSVSAAAGTGISLDGDRATLVASHVAFCDFGVVVDGADFEVLKNTVSACHGGMQLGTGTVLGRVEGNHVSDCTNRGLLLLDVNELVVRKNVVERCGQPHDPGLHVVAEGALIESNTVRDCNGTGFLVVGSDNLLRKNKAIGNLLDGFLVPTGDNNRFESCSALGNRGEGFQNDDAFAPGNVSNTQLAGCKAKGNRRDIAVITAFSELGVSFSTGGNDPLDEANQPEIEDS